MSVDEPTRRLAAILAADIVNYTRLVETDEAGTLSSWRVAIVCRSLCMR